MGKLWMIAGRQVSRAGEDDRVAAYVVLSAGPKSRIFAVRGTMREPTVSELPAATTIDMRRFEAEIGKDLQADTAAVKPLASPAACGMVRDHLKKTENLSVD